MPNERNHYTNKHRWRIYLKKKKKRTEEERTNAERCGRRCKMLSDMKDGHNIINSFNSNHTEKRKHCPCIFASREHFIYGPPFSHRRTIHDWNVLIRKITCVQKCRSKVYDIIVAKVFIRAKQLKTNSNNHFRKLCLI